MRLFKLVNKTNQKTYPQGFNAYTNTFHFDGRITKTYMMTSTKLNPLSVGLSSEVEVLEGNLEFLGDIKTDLKLFKYYLESTNRPADDDTCRQYWKELMIHDACDGEAALAYMVHNNMANLYTKDELLSMAIQSCSTPSTKYLLNLFQVKNAEAYIADIMSLIDINFVEVLMQHVSTEFISNLNVAEVTAKHRYADVRKYLTALKTEVNKMDSKVLNPA